MVDNTTITVYSYLTYPTDELVCHDINVSHLPLDYLIKPYMIEEYKDRPIRVDAEFVCSVKQKGTSSQTDYYQSVLKPDGQGIGVVQSGHDKSYDGNVLYDVIMKYDTYVTYEIDWVFYGERLEVAKEWATFVRADGHRLTEIISNKNMLRFYKKYPELRSKDIWLHIHTYDNKDYLVGSVGLLNDSVAHQYAYAPGIVEDVHYPLELILPYLSKEAKSLIAKRK